MQDEQEQDIRDIRAVHAVLQGRHERFREIVNRYTGQLYSLSFRMTGSQEDAEDAVQEIFSRAFRQLSSFDTDRRFFPWLYTVALNYLRSRDRSAARRHGRQVLSLDDTLEHLVSSPDGNQPEQKMLQREAGRALADALKNLRPEHREVFVLRHMEGHSGRDVAEMLSIPENTVKTYARRARTKLRTLITGGGTESET